MTPEMNFLNTFWGQAGAAGVLALVLFIIVRTIYNRLSKDKMMLVAELARRDVLADADKKLRDATIANLYDQMIRQAREDTSVLVKTLSDVSVHLDRSDRSRRKLDATMGALTMTLFNLPCNRGTEAGRPTKSPLPVTTPPSGMEQVSDDQQHSKHKSLAEDETRILAPLPEHHTPHGLFTHDTSRGQGPGTSGGQPPGTG